MATNPLRELRERGQSIWIDLIRRDMLMESTDVRVATPEAGTMQSDQLRRDARSELQRLIEDDGATGLTSNPTIFQKAITGSSAYDEQLTELARAGKSAREIFEALAIEDLRGAADLFRSIYDETEGADGFVSMEVSPDLAFDTQGTLEEARRLHATLDRPNVMIKIPGTAEGLPAIEQATFEGINVNITLLFSVQRYRQVIEAYLRGLERRVEAGLSLDRLRSVASFFVSRVDTLVDKLIAERRIEPQQATALQGRIAVANARLAYQAFREAFEAPRFERLRKRGANVQRPLWASTSTKNPKYSDVLYVETLIGPDTVNTMPLETIEAFRDHGRAQDALSDLRIEPDLEVLEQLRESGISLEAVTARLQDEGVKSFADSFTQLLEGIRQKRAQVGALATPTVSAKLGALQADVDAAVERLHDEGAVRRLWANDPSLWKNESDHQKVIRNRLGWLTSAQEMLGKLGELTRFGREVRDSGIRHVVLLGMGGSSLAPEVLQATIGNGQRFPSLAVLDTTVPTAVRAIEDRYGYGNTLFIVASKSGGTVETASMDAYFYERARSVLGDAAGQHFIAITDPGSALEQSARERGFRRIFLNPENIGGRYSALSYFGLVPAALIGVDLQRLVERATVLAEASSASATAQQNPGLWLGAALGAAALKGVDKLTLLTSPTFRTFGYWVEQLVAESTGKDLRGIVPVEGEAIGAPAVYGEDRLFVYLRVASDSAEETDAQVAALEQAGLPVIRIALRDAYDLGAEFLRWEIATALAGALLGINPFDELNVTESKTNTRRLLDHFKQEGRMPPVESEEGMGPDSAPAEVLRRFLKRVEHGDYIAILAYLEQRPEYEAQLQAIRTKLRDKLHLATTLGYGPRFLHSTGQLHKGGPKNGVFLEITADDVDDLPIPGQPFGFSTLKTAQALGDYQSLRGHRRRVIILDMGRSIATGLQDLAAALDEALA
jgi:transaldolase/glucose-6-phosphate isomerase